MSDTPRTDNEAWSEGSSVPELVTAELARQLERELTAAREELANAQDKADAAVWALTRVQEENAPLKAELLVQARLLGMSGEREADLRGEIERLRRRVEAADDFAEVAEELITPEVCVWNPKQADKLDSATRAYRATEGKK